MLYDNILWYNAGMKRTEGFIAVTGGKVWYKIVGENKKNIPLILVHGGPGYPHDYLEPLEAFANNRQVIFYDQLGCGNSEKPSKKSLWTVDRFVIELQTIIQKLGFKNYHILGQSWGAALAACFALTQPKGLVSLILSDPFLSESHWEKDAKKLLQQLPKTIQKTLQEEKINSKAYKKAALEYYHHFVWRIDPLPVAMEKSHNKMSYEIYNYMWGPEEFRATGTLKNFDLTKRLSEITVPVLLLCGRYDEATPESTQYFQSLFPNAKLKIFEKSAHLPFWTEKDEYIKTVENFLKK